MKRIFLAMLVFALIVPAAVFADKQEVIKGFIERGLVDPDIPDSWFVAPQTASQWGIREFNQSPLLDERVRSGQLPRWRKDCRMIRLLSNRMKMSVSTVEPLLCGQLN